MLETKNMDLGPWSNNQFNRIFRDYAPTNGYVDVTSTKAGAAYYCYGSVLDNGSNDPTSILPTEYGSDAPRQLLHPRRRARRRSRRFVLPDRCRHQQRRRRHGHLPVPVAAARRRTTRRRPSRMSFTLAAGASVRYENVLAAVFGARARCRGRSRHHRRQRRSRRHEPDLQRAHRQGRRHLRSGDPGHSGEQPHHAG